MSGTSKSKRARGSGLPTTMMIAALMLALGFTVVAMGFNHLNVSARLTNIQHASNLADSAIAKAIEEVILDKNFGTPSGSGTLVQVTLPNAPTGADGVLSFDEAEADSFGINYSYNNLDSDTSASGDGREVPPEAVHLVAVGRCNGVERKVEAVIYVPRFPYGLAANGPINSGGGLLVAEVADASVLDAGYPIPDDKLLPGNVATNSTDATGSIDFNTAAGDITIKGDLQSRGGASLNGSVATPADWASIVEGETRLGADQVELPDIDVTAYAPDVTDPDVTSMSGGTEPTLALSGVTRSSSSLTVTNDLDLNGGVLYVDGDLTVNGGVKGKGAVVATGKITITGNSSATSDNRAALLSGNGIELSGTNKNAARFEGLIYSHGPIQASNITLSGTAVSTASGSSSYTNVDLYQVDELAEFSLQQSSPDFELTNVPSASYGGVTATYNVPPSINWTPFQHPSGELAFNVQQPPVLYLYNSGTNSLDSLPSDSTYDFNTSTSGVTVTLSGSGAVPAATVSTLAEIESHLTAVFQDSNGGTPPNATQLSIIQSQARQIYSRPGFIAANDYQTFRQGGGAAGGGGGGGGGGPPIFSVKLSDFLNLSEKLRVLYWKEQRTGE